MSEKVSGLKVSPCSESEFLGVLGFIKDLKLDDKELDLAQFLVGKNTERIIGFGRLRNYGDCNELCSLGVIETFRYRGVGTKIAMDLIKKSTKPLYVVTVLPEFFKRLGFIQTTNFPSEIGAKIKYCTASLPVKADYIAMKLK